MTYLPPHFREDDPQRIGALIDAYPLATLVAHDRYGLHAHHIPLLLEPRGGDHGTLIGHVARNNTVWSSSAGTEVLAVFQAADAYITPNWYPTKQDTHEVVPTWNYAVVHVWGPLVVHEDEKWLRGAVGKLTKVMERTNTPPWKMGDAPQDYITSMLGSIVGIEIPILRIIGKWKASQNRNAADHRGVVEGLRSRSSAGDLLMADIMTEDP
jgi:transcriptional regulator